MTLLRRNGTSETLTVPLNSYPCQYESFKRECKIVAISALKFCKTYFNYSNTIKIKKWEDSRSWWTGWVPFRAPVAESAHRRLQHSQRLLRSVALAPHPVRFIPSELLLTSALVSGLLPCILGSHFWLIPQRWKPSLCFSSIFWGWNAV